ncbi:histidine phosphatase family protein [Rhodococcus sp. 4CII]|uniref:histidine phosphatase family protein n=2 Tax=unclassified Rhodococcus (in: high G+C Gram-positive bacteria) TaxID=192944 RepID=UPI00163A447A|nr:histidine phosphatase family protein [Rhodococcus sp. 4CII]MBC2638227.1 histidine phosphatase family protein [Rhodococcus sp. 3A]MBC2897030.1 histidine phosphatase family protein [Rhodococcus sp. 4CII]
MFVLLRHAHAIAKQDWTGPDARRPLSAVGRNQAEGLFDTLTGIEFRALYCSPTTRCLDTVLPRRPPCRQVAECGWAARGRGGVGEHSASVRARRGAPPRLRGSTAGAELAAAVRVVPRGSVAGGYPDRGGLRRFFAEPVTLMRAPGRETPGGVCGARPRNVVAVAQQSGELRPPLCEDVSATGLEPVVEGTLRAGTRC